MNRLRHGRGGPLLALTWIVTSAADLLLRDPAMMRSGAGALQSALTAGLLLWPMTVGLAAATTVRPMRPGLREIVLAAPDGARLRLVTRPLVVLTGWTLSGLALSVLMCVVVAGAAGSWAAGPAFLAVIPTVTGTVAAVAVGGTLGLLCPFWVVPPAAAVLTYLGYLVQVDAFLELSAYISASARAVVVVVPDPQVVVRVVAAHLLLSVCAAAIGAARLTSSRRIGAAALGVGVATVVLLALGGSGQMWYRALPSTYWACEPVTDGGSELCLPREQSRDLAAARSQIVHVDDRLRESFASPEPLRYGPVAEGVRTLPVPVPFGDLQTYPTAVVQSIAGYVVDCAARSVGSDAAGLDDEGFEDFFGYVGYLQGGDVEQVGGDRVPAMSLPEARSLVDLAVQGCREG